MLESWFLRMGLVVSAGFYMLRTVAEEIIAKHNAECHTLGSRHFNFEEIETWLDAASVASIRMQALERAVTHGNSHEVKGALLDVAKWSMVAYAKYCAARNGRG